MKLGKVILSSAVIGATAFGVTYLYGTYIKKKISTVDNKDKKDLYYVIDENRENQNHFQTSENLAEKNPELEQTENKTKNNEAETIADKSESSQKNESK